MWRTRLQVTQNLMTALNLQYKVLLSMGYCCLLRIKILINKLKSCIVYRFRCAGCGACYVGETSRHICTRINEHLNMDKASHIFKHLQDSPRCRTLCSSECFVVIDQATTRTQLKIKEALHIHWEKPSLNQQLFHVNLNLSL